MNTYDVDTAIQLSVAFANVAGTAVDPTTVNIFLYDPCGVISEHTTVSGVVHDGTGAYHYVFLPPIVGIYAYKWQGTGAVEVTSPDTYFQVRQSVFNPTP